MKNLNWPLSNPDLVCECTHELRVHSVSYYQDMQQDFDQMGNASKMFPVNAPYEEWSCKSCNCREMKVSNLRYLEQKYDESKSTI